MAVPKLLGNDLLGKAELPNSIWSLIIEEYILDNKLHDCLQLRQVNSYVNNEVLRALFIVQIKDLRESVRWRRVPEHVAVLQLQGFFGKRKLPQKAHKITRKIIFRLVGHDPHHTNSITGTCFQYQPGQICPAKLIGSSSVPTSQCKIHDMLNAMVSTFGSFVFGFGSDSDEDYDGALPKDKRYWLVLLACYRNDIPQVKNVLKDLLVDEAVEEGTVTSIFADCFVIATREDRPHMIDVLHEEAKYHEEVAVKLGKRSATCNPMLEAIRLKRCEVLEKLLKWRWKFNHDTWTYKLILKKIIEDASKDQAAHEQMLRLMLEWTETWRNLNEMKDFLIQTGSFGQQAMLGVAIEVLQTQECFRYDTGGEGNYHDYEPLYTIAHSGNADMVKVFLEHRWLLLPNVTAEQDKHMRQSFLKKEFARRLVDVDGTSRCDARVQLMKLVIEHSSDLLESKHELQEILVRYYHTKLEIWAWLAKLVGVHSLMTNESVPIGQPRSTLGSVMLEASVRSLNVESTRFLVNNRVILQREAATSQVYEDDQDTMARLETIKTLLERAGQGEFKERRVFETTFVPAKLQPKRPRRNTFEPLSAGSGNHKTGASARISTTTAAVKSGGRLLLEKDHRQ